MKEYMMIFRNEKNENAPMPSPEQMNEAVKQWQSWIGGIAAKGKFSGTNRLMDEGKTLKANKIVTDGPYVEGKEMVGGYLIVKANSLDEATEMAKGCPYLVQGAGNVEIRSVMPIDSNPASATFLYPVGEFSKA
jgi:hypothetical protein